MCQIVGADSFSASFYLVPTVSMRNKHKNVSSANWMHHDCSDTYSSSRKRRLCRGLGDSWLMLFILRSLERRKTDSVWGVVYAATRKSSCSIHTFQAIEPNELIFLLDRRIAILHLKYIHFLLPLPPNHHGLSIKFETLEGAYMDSKWFRPFMVMVVILHV